MLGLPRYFGHEVYVLSPGEIKADEHEHAVNVWHALASSHDLHIFIAYVVGTILFLSLALALKRTELFQRIGKFIDRATVFAPDFIRIVFGASLIFSARHHAVFGPELPMGSFSFHQALPPLLYISGVLLILGVGTRIFAALIALFWLFTLADKGWYMLTYMNYLGEALALILLPRQNFGLDRFLYRGKVKKTGYEKWSMPAARILFGASLLYTAINVKFVTSNLSLDVVHRYDLQRYFHYDPLLIVLGAGMVEILIAVLYMLGFLQRLNSLIFIGFLVLSISFFKESVWPHYLLLALAIGIFAHKPDALSLDSKPHL